VCVCVCVCMCVSEREREYDTTRKNAYLAALLVLLVGIFAAAVLALLALSRTAHPIHQSHRFRFTTAPLSLSQLVTTSVHSLSNPLKSNTTSPLVSARWFSLASVVRLCEVCAV
jgi:lysylphosphatidylglycerol synthetase-like protein (DUF2156 family)